MQKQKSKNKLKPRELNRKGAEKEGTDMDAFVNNTVPTTKTTEIKQDNKEQHVPVPRDSNKEPAREISKDIKEKDNYESKKEILPVHSVKAEKHAPAEVPKESAAPVQTLPHSIDKLPTSKESSPKKEDNAKSNTQFDDVVDHAFIEENSEPVEPVVLDPLVAQKNEENFKASAFHAPNDEKPATIVTPTITEKKQQEVKTPSSNASNEVSATPRQPSLKYDYKKDQWSPANLGGKKIYDRDFLMKLQFEPNSRIKPPNLPNLQAVLKDSLQV